MSSNPMAEISAIDQASDLPASEWDDLLGTGDLHLSTQWLQVAERTAGVSMRYFLAFQGERLVAGLPSALANETVPWVHGRPDTLLTRCAEEGMEGAAEILEQLSSPPSSELLPSLVCGGRHIGRTRAVYSELASDRDILGLIIRAEEQAKEFGARSITFPYVDHRDQVLSEALSARGYIRHNSGEYAWLPVPELGFDEYLANLPSKRRVSVKAERKRIAASEIEISLEQLDAAMIPRLAVLEVELLTKYGVSWNASQASEVLAQVLSTFGDAAQVCVARADDEIRGFCLLIRYGSEWFARQAGFDYEHQGKLPLYYEIVYYRPIELAAELKLKSIHYGTASTEAKRSRGCLIESQSAFILKFDLNGRNRQSE